MRALALAVLGQYVAFHRAGGVSSSGALSRKEEGKKKARSSAYVLDFPLDQKGIWVELLRTSEKCPLGQTEICW